MAQHVLYYHLRGHWACLLDIPLLYESALDPFVGYVILIAASSGIQLRRLRERDPHLSEQEAKDRIASQMAMGEKVGRTRARGRGRGRVVWNEGGRGALEGKLGGVVVGLRGDGKGGRRWREELWRCWLWGSPLGVLGVGGWEVWRNWRARVEWERRRIEEGEVNESKEEQEKAQESAKEREKEKGDL